MRKNVREQILKLTRQPDRGILRAMDRDAAVMSARALHSLIQEVIRFPEAAINDPI